MEQGTDKTRFVWAGVALIIGAIVGALIAGAMSKPASTETTEAAAATEETAVTQEAAATETEDSEATAEKPSTKDASEILASWDTDSEAYKRLTSFVEGVCDPAGKAYVEPEERIATFDMDGTILCEKGPIYVDQLFAAWHVLEDDQYEATEQQVKDVESVMDLVRAGTPPANANPDGPNLNTILGESYAGYTPDELAFDVIRFASTTEVGGFEGMTYAESFYQPMREVIEYLRANDFDVYMVSACERLVARPLLVTYMGFAPDHVVGSDMVTKATGQKDALGIDYTFEQDDEVEVAGPMTHEVETGKTNKVLKIVNEIGRRPILSFGNSSGDYAMLNYATANPDHEGLGFLVLADDEVREYGSSEKAAEQAKTVQEEGWVGISMSEDWKTIYGAGVERTELPAEELLAEAA